MSSPAAGHCPQEMPAQRSRGISIFARILLAFLVVSIATSVVLTVITYSFNTDSIERYARSSITQQIETIQGKFDQTHRIHLDRSLRGLAASSLLDDYLFSSSAESPVAKKRLERLFRRMVDDSDNFESILFIDVDGKVQINTVGDGRPDARQGKRAEDEPAH